MIQLPLSLLLYGEALGLVVVLFMLAKYVGFPLVILWGFFRSEQISPVLKNIVGGTLGALAFLVVGVVSFIWLSGREAGPRPRPQPVRLTVQQPGFLPFLLGRGSIEQARYDTVRLLVVSGDLSVGGRLQARFAASPGFTTPFETNTVAVNTEAGTATQAAGQSVYDSSARTVSGSFRCVLPSGKRLSVSFPPTPVVLQGLTP